ncbi:hypothetical protein F4808DRAFT_467419 [Astrocystis sublimbata]|nr:hypothetical protein F4808DRAFT_467419 [Astrocystis sublimbata]
MDPNVLRETLLKSYQGFADNYRHFGPRLAQLWSEMGPTQRARVANAGTIKGRALKHRQDRSIGQICDIIPEWNLRDIAAADSDYLIRMMEHRATNSLEHQYRVGFDNLRSDHEHIVHMMRTRNLRHPNPFKDCYVLFKDGDEYGKTYELSKDKGAVLAELRPMMDAGLCVPKSVGELVLERQNYLLAFLNDTAKQILNETATKQSKSIYEAQEQNLSELSANLSMSIDSFILLYALQHRDHLHDNLAQFCREPAVLHKHVHHWFCSRPELIPDEKGRRLPTHATKPMSIALFDAVHCAVQSSIIWSYLCILLGPLSTFKTKTTRRIVLQEISNICHFEYQRMQAILKRQLSSISESRWFQRVSNAYDNGNARIILKGKPEALAGNEERYYFQLRLCQAEVDPRKALEYSTKLRTIGLLSPVDRVDLRESVATAIWNTGVIIEFIDLLSKAGSMPTWNRHKGQRAVMRAVALESRLNESKSEIDLSDFVVPIDKLKEPGMPLAALQALDAFTTEKAGAKLGVLYQDIFTDCIFELQEELVVQSERDVDNKAGYIPFPPEPPKAAESPAQERRQKEKTRPQQSSKYEISFANFEAIATAPAPSPFKVKAATAEVFWTLFGKAEARGSIPWANFEAAMAELKFSVIPKFGSVYTFYPTESMFLGKSVTFHRPHGPRIEGHLLLEFAQRLNRLYGWGKDTFQVV